jgi:hypothetical protein
MAKGHQYHVPELPQALVEPGIIIRMSVNLGAQDRVIQFETFADRDESQAEIDRRCDVMRRAGDRQHAIYALPDMLRRLEDIEYRTNDNKKRLAELNAGEKAMDEARAEKRKEFQAELQNAVSRAEDEHVRSGRRGEFKAPAGATRAPQAHLETLANAEAKDHAENEIQRAALRNEIRDGDRAIFQQKQLVAEHEALMRGEPANDE